MKTNVCFIKISFLLFIILYSCNKPGRIRFENEIYDFGEVHEGVDVHYTFVFKNNGTKNVTIRYVQPSCVCLTILDWDAIVKPGEKGEIPVTFKTPELNGDVVKYIDVKTDDPEQQSIKLTFKGSVIIPVKVVPRNLWLGEVDEGTQYLSGSFKIKINPDTPMKIIEVTPPDNKIQYTLTTIEENKQFSLDFIMHPPFEGEETIEKKFILRTNNKENEFIELKFFYFVPQPSQT